MVDLYELQYKISRWDAQNHPKDTVADTLLGVGEELGEVMRAQVKQSGGIRGTHDEWQKEIIKEIGDVMIGLMTYANKKGISVEAALLDRWNTISQRDYVKHPFDGGREAEC